MSYEPTNWKTGDVVTSAKLNKLEQGVAGGGDVLVLHEVENGTLDKTWQEIHDAMSAGQLCILPVEITEQSYEQCFYGFVARTRRDVANYYVDVIDINYQASGEIASNPLLLGTYISNGPDSYPSFNEP